MDTSQELAIMLLILAIVIAVSIYTGMKLGVVSITIGNRTYGSNATLKNLSKANPGGLYTGGK